MSQSLTRREIDAFMFERLAEAGLTEAAVYDGRTECVVLVDPEQQFFGDDPQVVVGVRTVGTFRLAEVDPKRGKRLTLPETGQRFSIGEELARDEARVSVVLVPAL